LLNAVVAEDLPGPGSVFLHVDWSFKAPVRPGDEITAEVEVLEVREDKPIAKLRTRITRRWCWTEQLSSTRSPWSCERRGDHSSSVRITVMEEVGANFICRPYRGVSVQEVKVALDPVSLRDHVLSRPVYRRTEFLVLVRNGDHAVVQVDKASTDSLFSPVTGFRYLAGPEKVAFIDDDRVETGNASDMARAALTSGLSADIYVVQGRFHHVNFIVRPSPLRIRVVEVIPPEPPKLLEMARRVLEFDEDLPPIELELAPIDLRKLAAEADAPAYLFPCRSAGLELNVPVDFLDAGPPQKRDWTLVGCERSRQIHEFFYGSDPSRRIDFCPKRADMPASEPTITKCCLIERGIESLGAGLVVPWGATLEEVREALHQLVEGQRPTAGTHRWART
jgi:hypothetical protein